MTGPAPKDLVVLVADADAAKVFGPLLSRHASLRIREARFEVIDLPSANDAWLVRHAHEALRGVGRSYRHALVVFDHHGSGFERHSGPSLEEQVERRLCESGWAEGAVAAIAIEPELEAWAWGRPDVLARFLNVPADVLRTRVRGLGLDARGKAPQPKEALRWVCTELTGQPLPVAVLVGMARRRGRLDGCQDRAFRKLLRVLREWFPADKA
jgi:hypothetical protein